MERQPNTEYILSLSYGKDSIACLEAIRQLGWPLDRIVHAEVWATDTIHADLPPMVEFKAKADAIIKERYGIDVEHVCAMKDGKKLTYEDLFYHVPARKSQKFGGGTEASRLSGAVVQQPTQNASVADGLIKSGHGARRSSRLIYGWPATIGGWCKRFKEMERASHFSHVRRGRGADTNTVQYLGIAADEPERIARHTKPGYALPLVAIGWDEAYCRKWCEENDLLSPIYTSAQRGGCWFCHNQGVDQLRLLRKNYPEYWSLMLKWDNDSPVTFKPDGHTVHDFDARFAAEDAGLIRTDVRFKWDMIGRKIVKPRVELPGQMTMEELMINVDHGFLI